MDTITQKKLKDIEVEILKEFIKVCEKLQLRYYVIGGTLLGAVRHKGFIPWDDDIDIGMPREDYEIFIEKGQHFLGEGYFLQNIFTDIEFSANYSKIRDSRTTFIESTSKKQNINHGVFIDVFPLDYYEDDIKKRKKFNCLNRLLNTRISLNFYLPNSKKNFKYVFGAIALKMVYPSVRKTLLKREHLLKSVKSGKMIANHCGAWGVKEIVPAEWYGEGFKLDFEGIPINAPKEYDKWLTQVYGDYMKLPPEGKRVTHHYTEIIDLENSYIEYIKEN